MGGGRAGTLNICPHSCKLWERITELQLWIKGVVQSLFGAGWKVSEHFCQHSYQTEKLNESMNRAFPLSSHQTPDSETFDVKRSPPAPSLVVDKMTRIEMLLVHIQ